MDRVAGVLGAVALLVVVAGSPTGAAEAPAPAANVGGNVGGNASARAGTFSAGAILVETAAGRVALERPGLRQLGGRAFLVGQTIDAPELGTGLGARRTVWLALEQVLRFTEFDSAAQLRKALVADGPVVREEVEVEEGGTWWRAQVLEVRRGQYKIHYVGWGPEFDTWVTKDRIRRLPRASQ